MTLHNQTKELTTWFFSLAQLVRFLVVELTQSSSNFRFDMYVAFTANYSFNGRRHFRRQRGVLGDRLRESQD
jgi:hypothetical protein